MIGHIVSCSREDCDNDFAKTTHNMKFCSAECCRIQTNRKIMADYHENKAIRNGKPRSCLSCSTSLSRYNPNKYCGGCERRMKEEKKASATDLVAAVSWL
jgi:hypothetical protein